VILSLYKNSIYNALSSIYKESYQIQAPPSTWVDVDQRRYFFDQLGANLGIVTPEDWYNLSESQVIIRYANRHFN
jgi:hypothetical protein